MQEPLSKLEKKIRYKFKNQKLFEESMTHKSYAIENNSKSFNERLEFLGDAVLATVVAHYLFKRYPHDDEGKLSKIKSQLVSRANLTIWAQEFDLGKYLFLSGGEETSGGRARASLVSNAYEALLGAIFLDGGFPKAQRFVMRKLAKKKHMLETDYKSLLQEIIQKRSKVPPEYLLIGEKGPDHAKIFSMEARLHRKMLGKGEGRSKKESEQAAAHDALKKMNRLKKMTNLLSKEA